MLKTTARLLQHRGYHGTSLNDILEESGAPRGSLYFHFPGGKDQLVLEATRLTIDETTEWLSSTLTSSANPAQATRMYLEAAALLTVESDYTFGCPVAPLILDAIAELPELAALCRQAFEVWTELLRDAYARSGVPPPQANALALLASASIEGGLLMARSYRDPGPLVIVAAELERIVGEALSSSGKKRVRPKAKQPRAVGQS